MLGKNKRFKVTDVREGLRFKRPTTKSHLRNYIRVFLGVDVPNKVFTEGHSSAMDYLWYAFNADFLKAGKVNADAVVWANRGGGKTELSGILTLLDCVFKPGCQIRILSGSGYQAGRMYEYFGNFLRLGFEDLVEDISKWPSDKTVFKNGAVVEVLKQSETSVRSHHVHKLRCDEVELFKPKVYEAAQYTTMSTKGYVAALEAISTMHRRNGLMQKLVKDAEKVGKPVFKWNLWDVIEPCRGRICSKCELQDYCEGKARKGIGYYKIDDAITQLGRTKPASFQLEMLCGECGGKKGGPWNFGWRFY